MTWQEAMTEARRIVAEVHAKFGAEASRVVLRAIERECQRALKMPGAEKTEREVNSPDQSTASTLPDARSLSRAKLDALATARAKRSIAAPRTAPEGWRSVEHLLDDTREFCGRFLGLQSELAEYLQVDTRSVARWLKREKIPLQPTIDAIAQWRRVKAPPNSVSRVNLQTL